MSHDRINGMIWGFTIGFSVAAAAYTGSLWMLLWSIVVAALCYLFGNHSEALR
jgi:VIT1/CCC1 family predicted Fe2+/Mn2+ transporter